MEGQVDTVAPLLGDAPNPQPRPDAQLVAPPREDCAFHSSSWGVSDIIGEKTQGKKLLGPCAPRASHVSAAERSGGGAAGGSPPWGVVPGLACHLGHLPLCPSCVFLVRTLRVVSALPTGTPVLQPRGAPGLQAEAASEPWQEAWGVSDVVVPAFLQPLPSSEPLLLVVTALSDMCACVCARVPSVEPEPVVLRMALWSASVPHESKVVTEVVTREAGPR